MSASSPSEARLRNLIDTLSAGFEALIEQVNAQRAIESELRTQLDFAANEYERLVAAGSSLSEPSASQSQVAKQLRNAPDPVKPVDDSLVVRESKRAIAAYKMANKPRPTTNGATCGHAPVANPTKPPTSDMERDFTVPGRVSGNLGCPFASKFPSSAVEDDPIAAEFHQDHSSVRSPTTASRGGMGQCPIRFLDKHSPEEVAQYFQNHKHEIPRSHQICVKRYSADEQSARHLDAKYGSLVNMIQGLGVKHKAYLPERDKIEEEAQEQPEDAGDDKDKVEKWAENISKASPVPEHDADSGDADEDRLGHFEKPLREIRVGESPSRPWGIPVPIEQEPAPSAPGSDQGVTRRREPSPPRETRASKPGKCPVDHTRFQKAPPPVATGAEQQKTDSGKPAAKCPIDHTQFMQPQRPQPPPLPLENNNKDTDPQARKSEHEGGGTQIIFNGPVFFGYSAEQVAALLQSTNLGKPGGS